MRLQFAKGATVELETEEKNLQKKLVTAWSHHSGRDKSIKTVYAFYEIQQLI